MDTIRTTITLPVELHEALRMQAIREKKSLGEVVVEKFKGKKKKDKERKDRGENKKRFCLI